jgi:hypothetical protein
MHIYTTYWVLISRTANFYTKEDTRRFYVQLNISYHHPCEDQVTGESSQPLAGLETIKHI